MAVCYDKLFQLIMQRQIRYTDLLSDACISGNVMTRIRRGEYISMESVEKLCASLDCTVDDILEFREDAR